ncbi:MAG TPA: hypothetical protein VH969_15930 [Actinophytocola sp.]|uniref:hypothetical protein n=1 Tax=Actinophytocola sp. TaxID=1872138 RepID=UPI002F91EDF1
MRNGDEVVARGVVVAAPGRPMVFCPPFAQPDIASPQRKAPACADDPRAVVVTGIDVDRLSERDAAEGVSFGYAQLRGVWRDRTIAVTEQRPFTPDEPAPPAADEVPCPRPPGGWKRNNELPPFDADRLAAYTEQQPDRFGAQWVVYADAEQERDGGPDWPAAKQILVVGVVEGDLDDARRDLAPLYDGNLCVTRTEQSITRRKQVTRELEALWTSHPEAVVATAGLGGPRNLPAVDLVVMDQPTHDVLAGIGWEQFEVSAVIQPAR